jgi:small-conductance mechanosensitive channel
MAESRRNPEIWKATIFCGQVAASLLLWLIDRYNYSDPRLVSGFYTFLALAIIYLIFKIGLEHALVRRIRDAKTKYSVKKALSIVYILIFVAILIQIWVTNSQALLVSYGLIAAGIAVALQDFFKNFVGGFVIFLTGVYRVGDRIEVDESYGDVIDIGLSYTTMLEIRGWVNGDQATGRLTIIPNGYVLSKPVNNYSKDHSFLWDEISIPVTYDSDWKWATEKLLSVVKEETAAVAAKAEVQMASIMEKYYMSKRAVEPTVFVNVTDNWILLSYRYITDYRDRRALRSRLSEHILDMIESSGGRVKVSSETLTVSGSQEVAPKKPGGRK